MSRFFSGSNPNPQICACGTVYTPLHVRDVRKITGQLVQCKRCTKDAEPKVLFPHVYRRVFMDIAVRYIQWFGGHVFVVRLGFDRWELYLRNDAGDVIATVSQFDKYITSVDVIRQDAR